MLAGLIVWAALSALFVAATATLERSPSGQEAATAVFLALCFGSATSSLWLLLALVLDAFAGQGIGRRRLLVTTGAVLFTLISPVFVLGAQSR